MLIGCFRANLISRSGLEDSFSARVQYCKRSRHSWLQASSGKIPESSPFKRPRQAKAAALTLNDKVTDSSHSQPGLTGSTEAEKLLERSFNNDAQPVKEFQRSIAVEEDGFRSTWEHRFITGGTIALLGLLFAEGFSETDSPGRFLGALGAAVFAYYLSDFLTGIYHWGVDNYGDGSTPVVGSQIEAFQGHHQKPWTITQRDFCNNVHKVFKPAAPFTALCLLISPWTPSWFDVGLATATFLTCMSQQFHAWAHMKPSDLPQPVKTLQDAGILVTRKAHGAHHKAPFEGNYCIVSGFWNPILDMDGSENSFFRSLERFVRDRTGVEPRCWHEPDYSWQEDIV